jgi:hypothetical protein
MSFADVPPLMTVRFTETATGTKWLIKYLDGAGFKVFQKKRFLYKESPLKISNVYSKMNYINWSDRGDPKSMGGVVSLCTAEHGYLYNTETKIDCTNLSVDYSEVWVNKGHDERCSHIWNQKHLQERRKAARV